MRSVLSRCTVRGPLVCRGPKGREPKGRGPKGNGSSDIYLTPPFSSVAMMILFCVALTYVGFLNKTKG